MRITLFMQLNECLGRIQAFYSPFLQFLQDNPGGPGFPDFDTWKSFFHLCIDCIDCQNPGIVMSGTEMDDQDGSLIPLSSISEKIRFYKIFIGMGHTHRPDKQRYY